MMVAFDRALLTLEGSSQCGPPTTRFTNEGPCALAGT